MVNVLTHDLLPSGTRVGHFSGGRDHNKYTRECMHFLIYICRIISTQINDRINDKRREENVR